MRKGILMVLAGLMGVAPAILGDEIDFSGTFTNPAGTISTAGSNIIGNDIAMQLMQVNFGSGFTNYATSGSCAGFACLSFDANAGTINIVGGIPSLGVAPTGLLNGTGDTITDSFFGSLIDVSVTGPDTKSDTLLAALSLPTGLQFSIPFGFSIAAQEVADTTTYDAFSTDISNIGVPNNRETTVPEPSSIMLFGSVLLGCSALVRRRKL